MLLGALTVIWLIGTLAHKSSFSPSYIRVRGWHQLGPQRKGKVSRISVDKPLALFSTAP